MALTYNKHFAHSSYQYALYYNMAQYTHPPNTSATSTITIQIQAQAYGVGSSATFGYYLILSDNTSTFDESLGSTFDSHNILLKRGTIHAAESGGIASDNPQTITYSRNFSEDLSKFPNTARLYVKVVLTPSRGNNTVVQQNITLMYHTLWAIHPSFSLNDPVVLKRQHPTYNTPEAWGLTQNVSVFTIRTTPIEFKANAAFKRASLIIFGPNGASIGTYTTTSLASDGSASFTTDKPLTVSGDVKLRVLVTDSRDLSTQLEKTVKAYAYTPPTITQFSVERVDDSHVADEDGANARVFIQGRVNSTQPNYIRSLAILQVIDVMTDETVAIDPDANIETLTPLSQSQTGDVTTGHVVYFVKGNLFQPSHEYRFVASIVDEYEFIKRPANPPTSETRLYRSYCTMDFLAGGEGIAFGTTAGKEGFECDMTVDFNKTLNVDGNTTLNGTLNVAQATNLKNGLTVTGNSVFNGQIKITSVNPLDLPANSQIWKGGGRTFSRTYQNGATTGKYHCIATTGKVTAQLSDYYALLLVQEHYAQGKSGILEVGYRANASGTAGTGSVRWLVNDGWSNTQFTLKCRTTSGNACADLWVYLADWEEVNVTVLSAGSRNNVTNNRFYLRYDNQAGAASNSIPAAATDGGGNYNQSINPITASMMAHFANAYWGLMSPTRNSNDWIRTTETGLIPYKAGGGSSSLGTASWPFNVVVAQHLDLGPAGGVERVKDVVVNSGSSGAWTWRKWASGVAEVWGWKNVNVNSSTAWGNIYYGGPFSCGNWPFTFYQSGPIALIRTEDNNGRFWLIAAADNTTQSPAFYTLSAGSYGTQAIGICIYAKGYWRAANHNRI